MPQPRREYWEDVVDAVQREKQDAAKRERENRAISFAHYAALLDLQKAARGMLDYWLQNFDRTVISQVPPAVVMFEALELAESFTKDHLKADRKS